MGLGASLANSSINIGPNHRTSIDWSQVRHSNSNIRMEPLQPAPAPEPEMSSPDIALIRGQLLLKLLDIENSRCNAKEDEDDRIESLAQVLEGGDHVVSRIHSGMAKYMSLLGIEEEEPMTQGRSVFGDRRIPMTQNQAAFWDSLGRTFEHLNLPMDKISLMDANLHRGGSGSPEDQVTMTIRILR